MKEYTVVFTSCFLDHYTLALGEELNKVFKKFYFIADTKLPGDRAKLGFFDYDNNEYVIKAYENKELAKKIIMDADVVVGGFYKYESHMRERIKAGKLTLYSSERLFKSTNIVGTILRYIKYYTKYGRLYKNVPLLCVSAYCGQDYNQIFGLFKNNTYKWGYFSEAINYDIDKLINNKKNNSLLWVGRLIKWKHPEFAIYTAKKLKDLGYDFELNIIGIGPIKNVLENMINKYGLNDCVHMLGSMSPDKVRKHMETAEIYLFTSDRGEGWGVVLNEAMNSACACVASYSAGATPYLVKDNINGLIYKNDDKEEVFNKTKYLLDNKEKLKNIEKEAYETLVGPWSPKTAAERLYAFVEEIKKGNLHPNLYNEDVLSKSIKIY